MIVGGTDGLGKWSALNESLPGRIFISYRRQETAWPAGRLYDVLVEHFPAEQVFKDVDNIDPGDDFVERITAAVASCDVLLALIGPDWLTITDENGQRRLDKPEDYVRVEIETALKRKIRVIPILVDDARMPHANQLPPTMAPLVRRNAVEINPITFDTKRLIATVRKTLPELQVSDNKPDRANQQVAGPEVEQLYDRARRRRWRIVLASAIAVACLVGLLALALLFLVQGQHGAAQWASVIGALIAAAGFVIPLASRAMRRISSGAVRADQSVLETAAEELARALQVQWRDEARSRRLQDPRAMPVPWTLADSELADHVDLVFPKQGNQPGGATFARAWASGAVSDVAEAYEGLAHKRLVVLGSPGSGKSILAILLTLGVLAKRKVGAPVPVLFSVGSWDPSRTRLHDWMVDYLAENYELSGAEDEATRSVAERLLTGDWLCPILDGLDEVPVALRSVAIGEINRSLDATQPIILTCRTEEYISAVADGDVLTLAAVIELLPLDVPIITAYLAETTPAGRRGSRWDPVFNRLMTEPQEVLANVLSNPLMLSLARTIYGDRPGDPSELLDTKFSDRAALEEHLLDRLIPAAYSDEARHIGSGSAQWRANEVMSWLTYLARYVSTPGSGDLAWWQLEWALPKVMRGMIGILAAGVVVGLVFGPAIGVAFAALTILARAISSGPSPMEAWLRGRLALLERKLDSRSDIARLASVLGGLHEKVRLERRIAISLGRFAAMISGVIKGLVIFYASGNVFRAVAEGLAVALAVGLAVGYFTVSPRTTPSEVRFDTHRSVGVFLRHVMVGIFAGLCAGIGFGILLGSKFAIMVGVSVGLVTGLIDGLTVWLDVSTDVTRARSPQSTRREDRLAAVTRCLAVGVTVGTSSAVAFGLADGLASGLVHGLIFGIGFAIADPYFGLSSTLWGRYVVANACLALADRVPWRLMAFLEDARNHGLLRQVGAAYQFRHTRLQQRLITARP